MLASSDMFASEVIDEEAMFGCLDVLEGFDVGVLFAPRVGIPTVNAMSSSSKLII